VTRSSALVDVIVIALIDGSVIAHGRSRTTMNTCAPWGHSLQHEEAT
jgi:hypothetical protein